MKAKKYLSVIISVALIWALLGLSEKIVSDAYNIFLYIAFAVILIALFVYQASLRVSLIKILTTKLDAEKFLKSYQDLDGNKYTNSRNIYEALACIISGEFNRAEILLKNVNKNKADMFKADALLVLCYYLSGNHAFAKNAVLVLKSHPEINENKNIHYSYFAQIIEFLEGEKTLDAEFLQTYFSSIPKKDIVEVYIASYILAQAKLRLGDRENALVLLENVINTPCGKSVLHSNALAETEQLRNMK